MRILIYESKASSRGAVAGEKSDTPTAESLLQCLPTVTLRVFDAASTGGRKAGAFASRDPGDLRALLEVSQLLRRVDLFDLGLIPQRGVSSASYITPSSRLVGSESPMKRSQALFCMVALTVIFLSILTAMGNVHPAVLLTLLCIFYDTLRTIDQHATEDSE